MDAVTVADRLVESEASAELEVSEERPEDMECDKSELTLDACRSGQFIKLSAKHMHLDLHEKR